MLKKKKKFFNKTFSTEKYIMETSHVNNYVILFKKYKIELFNPKSKLTEIYICVFLVFLKHKIIIIFTVYRLKNLENNYLIISFSLCTKMLIVLCIIKRKEIVF